MRRLRAHACTRVQTMPKQRNPYTFIPSLSLSRFFNTINLSVRVGSQQRAKVGREKADARRVRRSRAHVARTREGKKRKKATCRKHTIESKQRLPFSLIARVEGDGKGNQSRERERGLCRQPPPTCCKCNRRRVQRLPRPLPARIARASKTRVTALDRHLADIF